MLIEQVERIMATDVSIQMAVTPAASAGARAAVAAAFVWLRHVEARLTRFVPTSELSRLNASAGRPFAASAMLFEIVQHSLRAAAATDGLFDPTILPQLEAAGYDRDYARIARRETGAAWRVPNGALGAGGWRHVELDGERRTIRLPAGAKIDLGGIAKGWAADVVLDRHLGAFANALVNVGGDLRARGETEPGQPWAVGVGPSALADATALPVVLTLDTGGLATSGATTRWWYRGGERQHHLFDPRTGRPAKIWIDAADDDPAAPPLIAAATALAPTAMQAEVAAKVALLRGYPAALGRVESATDDADAREFADGATAIILFLGTGEICPSRNLTALLATLGSGGRIWIE